MVLKPAPQRPARAVQVPIGNDGVLQISNCNLVFPVLLRAEVSSSPSSGARQGTSNQR